MWPLKTISHLTDSALGTPPQAFYGWEFAPGVQANLVHSEEGPEDFNDPTKGALAILQLGQETQSDLIVRGLHGRSGLQRLLLGSVAEKVLRGAAYLVLTVWTRLSPRPSFGQPWEASKSS